MKDLNGKIAFITGASSGFGKAIAYRLGKLGLNLIIAARRIKRINDIANELNKLYGIQVYPMQLDVRSFKAVKENISKLPAKWKKIEILINNAGLSRGLDKIYEGYLPDWEEMIDTNLKGLLYVTKMVSPLLIKNNSGHIVNIGSIAGHEVYPGGNVYCATKHAVDAITRSMRMDFLDTPVKVSTIDPGLAETEFSIVRFRGDKTKANNVYKGLKALTADNIADAVEYTITREDNMVVAEMILLPKCQASPTMVKRD